MITDDHDTDQTTIGPTTDPGPLAGADTRIVGPDVARHGVLHLATDMAARERERLEVSSGRRGLAALAARTGPVLRRLGTADAAKSGLRYRPIAWTLIAVTAVAFYLPGRADGPAPTNVAASGSVVAAAPPTTVQIVATTTTMPVFAQPTTPPPTFRPPPVSVGSPPTAPTTTQPPAPTTSVPPAPVPLRVRSYGWASQLAPGTVPGDTAVPSGATPVANRLGNADKVTFIRLAGTDKSLRLVEDADGSRETIGPGLVAACPITDASWSETEGQAMADAPAWDSTTCVDSVEANGVWTFDLSGFADRTGAAGFALVPAAGAPADFQVTFKVR